MSKVNSMMWDRKGNQAKMTPGFFHEQLEGSAELGEGCVRSKPGYLFHSQGRGQAGWRLGQKRGSRMKIHS